MANLEISFTPTSDHIHQIMHWMQHDERKLRDGLIDDWNGIFQAFSENRMVVALFDFVAVGFAVLRLQKEPSCKIDYLQVKSEARRSDIGKTLVRMIEEILVSKGILMMMGNSINKNSDVFWLKLGNKRLPQSILKKRANCIDSDDSLMYKILVDTLKPNTPSTSSETLELWASDDYKVEADQPADYVWSLEFEPDTRKLVKPIIVAADGEWKIKWSINGIQHKNTIVKRFTPNESYGNFLIVRILPR